MGDHQNQATANIEDISNRVNGLNISGKKMRRRPRKSLDEALRSFDETAVAFTEQANTVVKLLDTDGELNRADVESLCLVRTRGLQLVRLAQLLSDSAIPALVRQVICLDAEKSFAVDDLLEYFKKQIENITRRVIGISGSEGILRKIAEECYHQATSPTGELNPDDYLATSKSLCNCPGGPTLFQPMEDSVTKPPTQTPRYLFRAWDNNSTGINGEDVIASILSKDDNENRHKIDMVKLTSEEMRIRNLRLDWRGFDNGEYLSQGKLHIDGRSCTFSLRELKDSGLWDLYPEFNIHDVNRDPEVRTTWTNYVKKLRWSWQFTKKTTKAEVQCALGIAQKCFPGFDHDDMALLILSFRERKLQPEKPSFQNPFVDYIDYKEPAEVHRYSTLRKRLSELSKASGGHGMKLFEQLYDLEDTEED
ncbi:hypothetical protein CEK25_010340 [Fusarium fujikuroi]|nr:hypothetical protein CEK25_010340 [Fusarium fujikuroi]